MHADDISVIIGTPTYAVPAWLAGWQNVIQK